MARYIDADKVLPKIQYRERTYGCVSKMYSKIIKDAPTADVRPERHGEWIDFGRDNDYSHYFRCSKCGFEVVQSLTIAKQYLYCPKCGAKMDGKDV